MMPLLSQLRAAENGLEDAHITLCGAVVDHTFTKRSLERREALLIRTGEAVGKNEKERAAWLRVELADEYAALTEAENALTEARCACEVARLEWDLVRYQLRVLEPLREAA